MNDVKEDVERIISLEPEHISVYSLILEEYTKLYNMYEQNKIDIPSEEEERKMYWFVKKRLQKSGYEHYEISNFAKAGYSSKHNLDCWRQKEYIGFGCAAHSYTEGCRYSNVNSVDMYINNWKEGKMEENFILHEKQDKIVMAKEYILLGLRTIQGCNLKEFKEKFGYGLEKEFKQEIEKLKNEKLIEVGEQWIKLTKKGIDLANLVWEEFV